MKDSDRGIQNADERNMLVVLIVHTMQLKKDLATLFDLEHLSESIFLQ
jgi:hypothetical protein